MSQVQIYDGIVIRWPDASPNRPSEQWLLAGFSLGGSPFLVAFAERFQWLNGFPLPSVGDEVRRYLKMAKLRLPDEIREFDLRPGGKGTTTSADLERQAVLDWSHFIEEQCAAQAHVNRLGVGLGTRSQHDRAGSEAGHSAATFTSPRGPQNPQVPAPFQATLPRAARLIPN